MEQEVSEADASLAVIDWIILNPHKKNITLNVQTKLFWHNYINMLAHITYVS